MSDSCSSIPLDKLISKSEELVVLNPEEQYKEITVRLWGKGVVLRREISGAGIASLKRIRARAGQLILSRIDARNGAIGIVPDFLDGAVVSNDFPLFNLDIRQIYPGYLRWLCRTPGFVDICKAASEGTTNRVRLQENRFLAHKIHLPSLPEQRRIVARIDELASKIEEAHKLKSQTEEEAEALGGAFMGKVLAENLKNSKWEWRPLKTYAEINPNSRSKFNSNLPDRVTFVPMSAVDDITGTIKRPQARDFLEVSKGYTCFLEGDVIFARITPCMQNGKSAIAQKLVNGVGFGYTEFHVIRPGPKLLNQWLHILVRQKSFQEDAMAHFKGTAGQQRVPQSFLEEKIMPVPPLHEQRQLVGDITNLQSNIANLRNLQEKSAMELNAMLPSILDKGFRGEL